MGSLVENNIKRAMLMSNTPDYGFDPAGVNSNMSRNDTCTYNACRLFKEGNAAAIEIPLDITIDTTNAASRRYASVRVMSVPNVGTSAPDLVLLYIYLPLGLCNEINRQLGYTNLTYVAEDTAGNASYGSLMTQFPTSSTILGDQDTSLVGRPARCFLTTNGDGYAFYYVILAR